MTPDQAADWMLEQFEAKRFLHQEEAATHLHAHDEQLAYYDGNGNVCLGRQVLSTFKKLIPDAVYERADKFWRERFAIGSARASAVVMRVI